MSTLTLQNAEQKDALVQAVAYMNEYLNDYLGDRCRELEWVSDSDFAEALKELDGLRKRLAFTAAFSKALNDVPVGISVFLESLEVEVIREGLEQMLEVQDEVGDDSPSLVDMFSVDNIKQAVLASQTSWGSLDVEALSKNLSEQARQTVDPNNAAQDLLDALN